MIELFYSREKYAYGGYAKDEKIRFDSTSGGAFSCIVEAFCRDDYVIFGAETRNLSVFHSYITDKKQLDKFRKSKYSQSVMGDCFKQCKLFLEQGKSVLFSGTPCQIAGLRMYLEVTKTNVQKLLTVEVICEGVPSPLYIRKYEESLFKKYGERIKVLDYRYTGRSLFISDRKCKMTKNSFLPISGKWDFEIMKTVLSNGKSIKIDRWFNPFWSIWLNHLISRPSCGECKFAKQERVADISLGDLWGVHLYCPELYGNNGGSSLVIANTEKGERVVRDTQSYLYGHELIFEEALKYQSPMRKHIDVNPRRNECMKDLQSEMSYEEINSKWVAKTSFKLLIQKYLWGNRQKIALWNFKN